MMRPILIFSLLLSAVIFTSCMKFDYGEDLTEFNAKGEGLFIICEGDFQYGNASLSYYKPEVGTVENEVFLRANGMKLGDVAQSMTVYDNKGWIVVNNSHVIFAIDLDTFKETGRVENLTSPRYIHFVNDEKAYVSQIWDNRIFIINPKTYSITGYIDIPDMAAESGSTEQMVQIGGYVYCTCWSYQNRIIKIDTSTDSVVGEVQIGIQPKSLVKDAEGRLWTLTDGGYDGSPYGYEEPALFCIDPSTLSVIKSMRIPKGSSPLDLITDSTGEWLYWINDDVWKMHISATVLPQVPLIKSMGTKYFGLTVSPSDGDIYVADAIDYMQPGVVYRFSSRGEETDSFYVGVSPGAFCWK